VVCGIPAESENARVPSMTVLVILVECQAWLLEGHYGVAQSRGAAPSGKARGEARAVVAALAGAGLPLALAQRLLVIIEGLPPSQQRWAIALLARVLA
jgi:hypothetical protein